MPAGAALGPALIRGVHQGAWKNAGPLTDGVRPQPRAGLHYGARQPTVSGSANAAFIVEVWRCSPSRAREQRPVAQGATVCKPVFSRSRN
jgi:hypothetical protein